MARRSIVDQVVGNVKTEASKRPAPIDRLLPKICWAWYRTTKYGRPEDYVFSTDAPRAGTKRGKQPVCLSKMMTYQPAAKRAGITKHNPRCTRHDRAIRSLISAVAKRMSATRSATCAANICPANDCDFCW
jgi:hypothetical protein